MQHFWTFVLAGVVAVVPAAGLAAPPAAMPSAMPSAVPLSAALVGALITSDKPEIDADLRSRWRSAVLGTAAGTAWDGECEQDQQASGAGAGLLRQRLPDGSWLLRLDCSAGAYQGSFWAGQVWRHAGQWRGRVLTWPVAQAAAKGAGQPFTLGQEVVLSGEMVVQRNGAVEVLNRFRGPGDCGTRSVYEVKQGRVRFLVLAAVFACPDTPASEPIGPPDWPTIRLFRH